MDGYEIYKKAKQKPYNKNDYNERKERARAIAQYWQYNFSNNAMTYGALLAWQNYFETLGKRYGLIKEFKENGIL